MANTVFYTFPDSAALVWAGEELRRAGFEVADSPSGAVTHLLLGVPCKTADETLTELLDKVNADVTIFGGNLSRPCFADHKTADLLQDEDYLWQNARITAQIALTLGARALDSTFDGLEVAILGWGRIGQCLAPLLKALGANVTVAARKEVHRAQIRALGYRPVDMQSLEDSLSAAQLLYNTVPAPVLHASACPVGSVKIDLASKDGIIGRDVLMARALPGKYAPRSSGELIGKTVIRLMEKEGAK